MAFQKPLKQNKDECQQSLIFVGSFLNIRVRQGKVGSGVPMYRVSVPMYRVGQGLGLGLGVP